MEVRNFFTTKLMYWLLRKNMFLLPGIPRVPQFLCVSKKATPALHNTVLETALGKKVFKWIINCPLRLSKLVKSTSTTAMRMKNFLLRTIQEDHINKTLSRSPPNTVHTVSLHLHTYL